MKSDEIQIIHDGYINISPTHDVIIEDASTFPHILKTILIPMYMHISVYLL